MARELKHTNKKMSHFAEVPDETVDTTQLVDSDINSISSDNTSEENVSVVEDNAAEEFYVTTAQPLVLGGQRYSFGSRVPEEFVTAFYLKNGHIGKRKV